MKSEKGYIGVDIAISIVVLFIFVSLIASLSYRVNSSSQEIELKSKASELAVSEIETIKNKTWEDVIREEPTYREMTEIQEGYYRTILVQDYHDIDATKTSDIVKRIIVQIQYRYKGKTQTVELSTLIAKEK